MPDITPIPEHYATGFAPVANADARILILGTLPGIASLKQQQYYAHPRNAFWQILEVLFQIQSNAPYLNRCEQVKAAKLAIWDVCHSAYRPGSLDSAITHNTVIANDINGLLTQYSSIKFIAFNGNTAASLFKKHIQLAHKANIVTLPSTSPANARLRVEEKINQWSLLKKYYEQ